MTLLGNYMLAQTHDLTSQIKNLQLNSAPAFVILGVEPDNIQRPNSPTEFVSSAQSAVVNQRLQPNFSMETTPYFWCMNKKLNDQFSLLNYIINKKYSTKFLESISLSFATSPSDTIMFGKKSNGTGLGLGLHLQIVHGKLGKKSAKLLNQVFYETRTEALLNSIIQALEGGLQIKNTREFFTSELNKKQYTDLPKAEKEFLKNLLSQNLKNSVSGNDLPKIKKLRDELDSTSVVNTTELNKAQFPLTREGFMLELAFADARIVVNNSFDNISYGKTAVWLTPSCRFNINKDPSVINFFDIMAVVRLTVNAANVDSLNYIDVGGKIQWTRNRVSLASEFIYRQSAESTVSFGSSYTYKTDFTLSYKLNEMVTFKTTLGKNFDGHSTEFNKPAALFIVGGFSFGINGLNRDK